MDSGKVKLHVRIVEMKCWKCGSINHIFFVCPLDDDSLCYKMRGELWTNNKPSFNPKILKEIKDTIAKRNESNIVLSRIKERFSNTVNSSYFSFGCNKCDAIFGDYYVNDLECDSIYGDSVVCEFEIEIDRSDIQ